MKIKKVLVIITIFGLIACNSNKKNKSNETIIFGSVIDKKIDSLRLIKFIDIQNNILNLGEVIKVDENGEFFHKIYDESPEMYHLIYERELKKGRWNPIEFFNDNDSIEFKLNKENIINGGKLNKEFKDYNNKIETYFKPKIEQAETKESQEKLSKDFINYRYDYINKNESEFSYYMLFEDILYNSNNPIIDKELIKNYVKKYKTKFPEHIYSKVIDNKLLALNELGKGDMYISFSANDIKNRIIDISDIIYKNKITIIDLWAPWCAPCISKSKRLIPFYESYKNKGIEIIGVIGRIDSHKKYEQTYNKFKYPWKVLSEINNENNIWDKYRLKTEAGGIFVLDKNGIILSKNPTNIELERIINEILK
jgi:thiol-disulfide isomerase/thioredoxin